MILKKELSAVLISLLLLGALITLWLRSVYTQEFENLKAETNVLFFNSIEEAKGKLFLSRLVHDEIGSLAPHLRVNEFMFDDTLMRKEIIVFEAREDMTDSLHHTQMIDWVNAQSPGDSSHNVTVTLKGASLTRILMTGDSVIDVDFDTTHAYLSKIFNKKVAQGDLKKLRVHVVAQPFDNSFQPAFMTHPGKLGNIFFGTTEYAATVDNLFPIIMIRMLPEIGISLLLFLAISGAILLLYRNLRNERRLATLKDDFIGNMTHELKTPISVVNVAIEALSNFNVMSKPEQAREYLDISKSELSRLSGLVDRVLDISKDRDQSLIERMEVFSLDELTMEVLEVVRMSPDGDDFDCKGSWEEGKYRIKADPALIKSVLHNLLDNARKYGGSCTIEVSRQKKWIVLRVLDSGPGIPVEFHGRVFDKFFRIPNANIHDVKGYGLGLYHVKQIVEQHGGMISMESEPGKGTVFTIELPSHDG